MYCKKLEQYDIFTLSYKCHYSWVGRLFRRPLTLKFKEVKDEKLICWVKYIKDHTFMSKKFLIEFDPKTNKTRKVREKK